MLNANWTAGFDFRTNIADSKSQVYGRNENDDDFSIFGGYLQGKFALSKKFDIVLAGRVDKFNFHSFSVNNSSKILPFYFKRVNAYHQKNMNI